MFIEYSRDAISKTPRAELEQSLLSACNAMGSGNHVVCTETRDLAGEIVHDMIKTNHCIASYFDVLREHFSEIASVKLYVTSFIKIIHGDTPPSARIVGNKYEISIGIALTTQSEFWYKACFIAENIFDIRGYYLIYKACFPNGPYLKSDDTLGGGTTTSNVVAQKINDGRIVLCILDSDRHFPTDKIKDTASKVLALDIPDSCNVIITKSREVENLFLSKKILEHLRNNRLTQRDTDILNIIQKAEEKQAEARFYFDVKSGYSYKTIANNAYLHLCFAPSKVNCKTFTTDENCKNCKSCNCIIIQGLGGNFFSNEILNCVSIKDNIETIYSGLPDFMKEEWRRLASAVLSWCCACKLNVLGA